LSRGSRKLPIKTLGIGADVIAKSLSSPANPSGQLTKYMLAEAQKILRSTFGYDLVQVPNMLYKEKAQYKSKPGKDGSVFFMVNELAKNSNYIRRRTESLQPCQRGLLMAILGMFPCEGSSMQSLSEGRLWKQLHEFDYTLPKDPPQKKTKDNQHHQLGLLAELLEEFVTQM
jgi:hypothetical protein